MDQKCRTLAKGKSVVIFKFKIFKINISKIKILNFYVKIKISEKSTKNHFLNKNNLLLLVIIFAINIKIKNSIIFCWKIRIKHVIGNLDKIPMVIGLKSLHHNTASPLDI
jgi:hypothetical protein